MCHVVKGLAIIGGTVVGRGGPVDSDVLISAGRIVSVQPNVGTTETGHGGTDGRSEHGTVGAGADRTAFDASNQDHAVPAVGERSPAAGGGPGTVGEWARLDARGLMVVPGFIDLQCNGAVGVDITGEPGRLWEVAAALPRWGVTAWLPTVVSSPAPARLRAREVVAAGPPGDGRVYAEPLGLHVEGPFIDPDRRGAHDPRHILVPSTDRVARERWERESGVALVTLAPELPGALAVVRALAERGVVVAAGHSSAGAAAAEAAVDAGVRYVTHLFNGMAPLHHRRPGLVGVALTDERLRVGVIADGVHVDPLVVALAARLLGDRLSLVTDAMAALGLPPGEVRLGDVTATVSPGDGAVRLPDGTLAGSTLTLDRAVRNVVAAGGRPLAEVVAAVTSTPAALLGIPDRGVIAPGAVGDVVLLTPAGEVVATVVGGRVAHDARTTA